MFVANRAAMMRDKVRTIKVSINRSIRHKVLSRSYLYRFSSCGLSHSNAASRLKVHQGSGLKALGGIGPCTLYDL